MIYGDPVRSSEAHFVKTSGLRSIRLMLMAPSPGWGIPGAAVPDGARVLRAVLQGASEATQEAKGSGLADRSVSHVRQGRVIS
jgi:hypothetical protein